MEVRIQVATCYILSPIFGALLSKAANCFENSRPRLCILICVSSKVEGKVINVLNLIIENEQTKERESYHYFFVLKLLFVHTLKPLRRDLECTCNKGFDRSKFQLMKSYNLVQ